MGKDLSHRAIRSQCSQEMGFEWSSMGAGLCNPCGFGVLIPFLSQLLASASYDDTVKLYHEEEDDWVCCATLEGHESTVWSIAFDGSGQRLASCSDDKTVRIWQCYRPGNEEGELLTQLLVVC